MSPEAFKARLSALGLTQDALAPLIGKTARQVNRYSTGATPIPKSVQMLLEGRTLNNGEG
jgi:hypothetical protein